MSGPLDLDFDNLDQYDASELEDALHRLDELKQGVRARMRLVGEALFQRQTADSAQARVANMDPEQRQAMVVALAGIESAEAVQ